MRKCHLNTCPVGIATQDPELRKKFTGLPEHAINFCKLFSYANHTLLSLCFYIVYYLAEDLRGIMAQLGFRTINEMVGHSEFLKVDESRRNRKTAHLDLSNLLKPAWKMRPGVPTFKTRPQDHKLYLRLDNKFIDEAELSLTKGLPVRIDCDVVNTDRSLGTTLSNRISKKYGEAGLPRDTIHISAKGSAGQSLGAFLAPGITIELEGDANDYVGKGLSGGRVIIYPSRQATFKAEENVIVGNVCLYGATSGETFIRGIAAERFAVRNSGANAVVEGVGDHGCEYMTGGRVVVLGPTGRNFAAGMSGGIAYVLDVAGKFPSSCNTEMVDLETVEDLQEIAMLRTMIEDHQHWTGSKLAERVLQDFNRLLPRFVKVMPQDYKKVLQQEAEKKKAQDFASSFHALDIGGKEKKAEKESHGPNPLVMDLEDSMMNGEDGKKKMVKMDKVKGFMKYKRLGEAYRNPRNRIKDWQELSTRLSPAQLKQQTARCMDCGVPFCQSDTGCPISNVIPKWNDLVFNDRWQEALSRLLMTNK
jgi:glutamate synthase (NADH)